MDCFSIASARRVKDDFVEGQEAGRFYRLRGGGSILWRVEGSVREVTDAMASPDHSHSSTKEEREG